MGMFDYVRSDYKIFGGKTDHDLQTKSFDSCLETYYIDPVGQIHRADYTKTYTLEMSDDLPFIREVKTGFNGRVVPLRDYSGIIRLSGSNPNGGYCSAVLAVERGIVKKIIEVFP